MKQLIEDLISALEYHVEQTRPIYSTTVALQAAREALKSLPPQRIWVGLTDEEASEIGQQANRFDWLTDYSEAIDFVIEATTTKLKEKNYD